MQKQNFILDKKFYSDDSVMQSKEAFSDFTIIITSDGVEITDDNPQYVFDEFSNYCIIISNEFSL